MQKNNNQSFTINPYTMLALGEGCKRKDRKVNMSDSFTGVIECTLTTKTETFIPDTTPYKIEFINGDNSNKHCYYKFFNYKEKFKNGDEYIPVLTGSEIRGMLRTDFELITDSCLSSVDESPKTVGNRKEARKALNKLLDVNDDKSQSYSPCIKKDELCEACGLFGFVSDNDAKGSKIRITDGIFVDKGITPYSKIRTLQELASPSFDKTMFYSRHNVPDDLVIQNKKGGTTENTVTRGRKMYWHHTPVIPSYVKKTKRNCTIIPVSPNVQFKFKIFFENIEEETLKHLIAVVSLKYKEENKTLYHKFGKAKPLGYGSVKIEIDSVKVRKIEDVVENNTVVPTYNLKEYDFKDIFLDTVFDKNSLKIKEAKIIYDFNYLRTKYPFSTVSYPIVRISKPNSKKNFYQNSNKNFHQNQKPKDKKY